jgi:hypothetical protein
MARPQPAIRPPDFLRRWQIWALLMVLFLVPFFIHIPRSLNQHPVVSPLGDQLHIVLFGGITLLLYWFGPLQGHLWRAVITSAVLGIATEFLQLLVGRQALLKDFLLDLVGIALVVGFIQWRGLGRRWGKWMFWLVMLSIPVQLHFLPWRISAAYRARDMFPVLANFEKYGDRYLWSANMKGKLVYHRITDAPDGESTVLRVGGNPESHWPGAIMRRFPEDWSGYLELKLEARLIEAPTDTFKFGIRLDDYEGVKEKLWVAQNFTATREWRTFSMPIVDRQLWNSNRNLNLREMDRIIIYFSRPKGSVAIEVDNLRLE